MLKEAILKKLVPTVWKPTSKGKTLEEVLAVLKTKITQSGKGKKPPKLDKESAIMRDIYIHGFIDKCAELNIDPEELFKLAQAKMPGPQTKGYLDGVKTKKIKQIKPVKGLKETGVATATIPSSPTGAGTGQNAPTAQPTPAISVDSVIPTPGPRPGSY